MNSKNFNAAQKHFEKKRIQMEKDLQSKSERIGELVRENRALALKNREIQESFENLNKKYIKLLELSKLEDEDVQKIVKTSGGFLHMQDVFNMFGDVVGNDFKL